jgi:hypothetical protein
MSKPQPVFVVECVLEGDEETHRLTSINLHSLAEVKRVKALMLKFFEYECSVELHIPYQWGMDYKGQPYTGNQIVDLDSLEGDDLTMENVVRLVTEQLDKHQAEHDRTLQRIDNDATLSEFGKELRKQQHGTTNRHIAAFYDWLSIFAPSLITTKKGTK